MKLVIRPALVLLALFTILTGILYPLAVTAAAQIFPSQRAGSLIHKNGRTLGSSLVGQPFASPGYFWSRPSATSPAYNGALSSGSNLGPSNPALAKAVGERVQLLRDADPENREPVPVDLVTASASGLDPDISPAAAFFQVARVARARGLDTSKVRALVESRIEGRTFGVLGEPRVNVVLLNDDIDDAAGSGHPAPPAANSAAAAP